MRYYHTKIPHPSIESATFAELNTMAKRFALSDGTVDLLRAMSISQAAAWIRSSSMPDFMREAIYTQIPGLKNEVQRQTAEEVVRQYQEHEREREQQKASQEVSFPVWPLVLGGGILLWAFLK